MSSCDAVIISISGAVKKRWAFTPHTLPSLLSHGNLYNLDEFSYTDSQVAYSQSLNRLILCVVFLYLICRHTSLESRTRITGLSKSPILFASVGWCMVLCVCLVCLVCLNFCLANLLISSLMTLAKFLNRLP